MSEIHYAISPTHREPSGKRQRESTAQDRLNELARAQADAETALVRSQPHRRGENSPLAESAIGRFILQYALARELYDAAMHYLYIRGLWLAAIKAPRNERHGGSGADLELEAVKKWNNHLIEWQLAMKEAGGKDGLKAVNMLIYENIDLTPNFNRLNVISALTALGKTMGKI